MTYPDELIELYEKSKIGKISNYMRYRPELKKLLWDSTNFINYDAGTRVRLYYIKHNLFTQVLCRTCNKPTKIKYSKGIYTVLSCSVLCACNYVDPISGVKLAVARQDKIKKVLNMVDSTSGLTKYQEIGRKVSKTKSKINPDTGLSIAKSAAIKASKTMSKIDPVTGSSIYQQNSKKIKKSIHMLSPNGLSVHQNAVNKTGLIQRLNNFNNIYDNFTKGYKLLTTSSQFKDNKSNLLKYSCNKCGSIRESYWPYIRCTTCYPYNRSIGEHEVLEFCQSLTNEVISNTRQIIPPLELDIYIPDYNLAIEYDGIFWHSSYSLDSENRDYHLMKTQECEKQGIQLFHIFENEWVDPTKQSIWKSIIRNRLGQSERIYARKTEIRSVSSKDKIEFLEGNHLQGNCNSSVNIGLYLDDELVSLMTFGKSRYDKKIDWELLRFCNKLNTSVIGGASRLLKSFQKEYFGSIVSYADKRRSNGDLYKQLGFEFSHESPLNYFYWKDQGLESRIKYQKHKLEDKLEIFDSSLTESENMYNNGYRKIYDCGNQVWVL